MAAEYRRRQAPPPPQPDGEAQRITELQHRLFPGALPKKVRLGVYDEETHAQVVRRLREPNDHARLEAVDSPDSPPIFFQ